MHHQQKAQAIVNMGLVKPLSNGFEVRSPLLWGRTTPFFVKDNTCTCVGFLQTNGCEHLLAVELFGGNATNILESIEKKPNVKYVRLVKLLHINILTYFRGKIR